MPVPWRLAWRLVSTKPTISITERLTSAAALFMLMGTLENATNPKLLANTAKHFAFTCCGESNLYGMVDAQITVIEGELLAGNTLVS
jgi:hypothetical protein